MAKKDQKVTLSADKRPLYVAILLLVVTGALWFLYTSPSQDEADTAAAELRDASTALTANENRMLQLQSGQERSAAALLQRARQLDDLLPSESNKVTLVSRVDQVARATGTTLLQMNPVEDVTKGNSTASQFDVQIQGGPDQVISFLRTVTGERPLMTMTGVSVNIATAADSPTQATASMRLQVWSVTNAPLNAQQN